MEGVNSREQMHSKVLTAIKSLVEKRRRDGMACTACGGANYVIQWESFEQHLTIEEIEPKTFKLKIGKNSRAEVACGAEAFEIDALDIVKELTERTDQFSTDEEYVYVTCDDQGIVPPDDADWKLYTKNFERKLEDHSCGPFGVGSYHVGPEGGILFLDGDTEDSTKEDRTRLEVPKNATRGREKVEIRYSIRATEGFEIEEGYKLASMAVYINYNPKDITKGPILHLPHWARNEKDIEIAQVERERGQQIVLKLKDNNSTTAPTPSNVTVEIDSDNTLYAAVIKKGTDSRYRAVPYALPSNQQNLQEAILLVYIIYSSNEWGKILQMYLKKKKSQPNRLESSHVTFEFKDDQCMLKAKLNEPVLTRSGTIKAQLKEPLESAYIEMSGMHEMKPWQVNYKNYDLLTAAKLEEAVEEQRYPPCFCCQSKYTESPGDGEKVCVTVDLVLEGANIAMSFPCHTTAKLVKEQREETEPPETSSLLWRWFGWIFGKMFKSNDRLQVDMPGAVIEKYKQEFMSHVDASAIAGQLEIDEVIPDKISHEIKNNAREDANEILYLHLRHQSSPETLHTLCDVMKKKQGYPKMNEFGDYLKRHLPSSKKQDFRKSLRDLAN